LAAEKICVQAATCKQSGACVEASQILEYLKLKMEGYSQAERIKVDRDLVLDSSHYYKGSNLNPELHIKIVLRRESAVDTG